jgi:hypothetical protein
MAPRHLPAEGSLLVPRGRQPVVPRLPDDRPAGAGGLTTGKYRGLIAEAYGTALENPFIKPLADAIASLEADLALERKQSGAKIADLLETVEARDADLAEARKKNAEMEKEWEADGSALNRHKDEIKRLDALLKKAESEAARLREERDAANAEVKRAVSVLTAKLNEETEKADALRAAVKGRIEIAHQYGGGVGSTALERLIAGLEHDLALSPPPAPAKGRCEVQRSHTFKVAFCIEHRLFFNGPPCPEASR